MEHYNSALLGVKTTDVAERCVGSVLYGSIVICRVKIYIRHSSKS